MKQFFQFVALLIVALLAFSTLCCSGSGSPSLPNVSEIKSIEMVKNYKSFTTVPKEYFPKILALFQSGTVANFPYKWKVMDHYFTITTEAGQKVNIWLFWTRKDAGAFSIGPTHESRVYYRGSTDEEIDSLIKEID